MTWTKQSDDFADDCWSLSDAAYRLHDEGLIWSNRKLLDCRIPKDDLRRLAKRPEAVSELLTAGFWREDDEDYVILHHAGYQPTREQVIQRQAANVANGRRGGRPRKSPKTQSVSASVTEPEPAGSTHPETQSVLETQSLDESAGDSSSETETHRDGSTDVLPSETVTSRSVGGSGGESTRKRPAKPEPRRDDVEALCTHFADCMEANGSIRPTVSDAWRRAARLMLDSDRRELEATRWLIGWSQQDGHWATRVRAMPKFREEYDALRIAAKTQWERRARGGSGARPSTSDAAAAQAQALRRNPRPNTTPEPAHTDQVQLRIAEGF